MSQKTLGAARIDNWTGPTGRRPRGPGSQGAADAKWPQRATARSQRATKRSQRCKTTPKRRETTEKHNTVQTTAKGRPFSHNAHMLKTFPIKISTFKLNFCNYSKFERVWRIIKNHTHIVFMIFFWIMLQLILKVFTDMNWYHMNFNKRQEVQAAMDAASYAVGYKLSPVFVSYISYRLENEACRICF